MRFSERYGYKPVREIIQKESMNDVLENRLWNLVYLYIFNQYKKNVPVQVASSILDSNLNTFFANFYHIHIKDCIDELPENIHQGIDEIRSLFFDKYTWYEIYDFIEFCIKHYPFNDLKLEFISSINDTLNEENSAYQIIGDQIIEITSIEDALANTNQYSGVQQHLKQALTLLSDRHNPNYSKSIHDAICAVEGLARSILQDESITLGKALPKLREKLALHANITESLNKLYAYTCDQNGIRHGASQEPNLSYIDAKFMLVACTNFINYLIDKTKDQN